MSRAPQPPRWLAAPPSPGKAALRQALDDAAAVPEILPGKQRVWARVQSPWMQERRRMILGWGLAATATAALAIVAVTARRPEVSAGSATAVAVEPPPAPARQIATGMLTAGAAEELQRQLARGVDVAFGPAATLLAGDEETPPEVKRGRVRFTVPHQAPGHRYSVRAGAYRVGVLGTVFEVSVAESRVHVALETGSVVIEDAASGAVVARLSPGETWNSSPPAAAVVPAPAAAVAPEPPSVPPAARRAIAPAASADGGESAAKLLAMARRARQSGDARGALALYGRLVEGGGELAESALYEMAAIEDEDLHEPGRALRTWERYRQQHPRGLLRAEADLSVIEVLTRLGQEGRALDEARTFLRRYPGSERWGEVARVAGDLARTRGDCVAAVSFYDRAVESRLSDRDADDAAYHRLTCLAQQDDARASEAARAYLARYPRGRHAADVGRLVRQPAGEATRP